MSETTTLTAEIESLRADRDRAVNWIKDRIKHLETRCAISYDSERMKDYANKPLNWRDGDELICTCGLKWAFVSSQPAEPVK